MGKGLALKFKNFSPEMFVEYKELCDQKIMKVGYIHAFKSLKRWILNFPTKEDWRNLSKLEWIDVGLKALSLKILELNIHSVGIPALGCGEGGLTVEEVRPLIDKYYRRCLRDKCILFYESGDRNERKICI